MGHLSEAAELLVNGALTQELLALESEHRLVGEEVHQVFPRLVEG